MKANIKSEEEVANYKQFNNAWGGAYNMMAQKHVEEECEEGFDSDCEEEEDEYEAPVTRSMPPAQKARKKQNDKCTAVFSKGMSYNMSKK
jgi:hypothetical protein